ncbi:DUF6083 domain-containing protein [Streptomyces sp. NPDC002994]|uniref:DUF6083 domain-containing protein n=1 Tax=Streptomyces sp. NPDC002994 TaxID=3154441 RepID=UPI0033BB4EDF
MGDTGSAQPCPDSPDHQPGRRSSDSEVQAMLEGATAPGPPAPATCEHCELPQDRYPTLYPGRWVFLEPRSAVPAHHLPPRRRWIITTDGVAWNLWDAEPIPGTVCRVVHRLVCPHLEPEDPWPWGTALRLENGRRAQRLFNVPEFPDLRGLPDAG